MADNQHHIVIDGSCISTPRLLLRPWVTDDAPSALDIYGDTEVSRWLIPAMGRVTSVDVMTDQLHRWIGENERSERPQGR